MEHGLKFMAVVALAASIIMPLTQLVLTVLVYKTVKNIENKINAQ